MATSPVLHGDEPGGERPGVVEGFVHPQFAGVERTFRHQIARTSGGAAVAAYWRGELVVDLWGGSRTGPGDPWEQDTLAMCWSTTKGVTATALHLLADRGLVHYDTPVAHYWPEFAQNGKGNITVRHVLSHSAGLHRLSTIVDDPRALLDWDHVVDALARAKPAYLPGASVGYHALTFGWLVGEIVRRVSGQPLERFVADELARPLGLDGLHIGCPPEVRHRVAPLKPLRLPPALPSPLQAMARQAGLRLGHVLTMAGVPFSPRRLASLAPRGMEDVMYGREVMDAAIPAANGFFDARSLAAVYALLAGWGAFGDVRLLSPETVRRLSTVQNDRPDRVVMLPMQWRLGYHRVITSRGLPRAAFGHFGFGGSGAWADPSLDLAMAMVCNRGGGTPIGDLRMARLSADAIGSAQAAA